MPSSILFTQTTYDKEEEPTEEKEEESFIDKFLEHTPIDFENVYIGFDYFSALECICDCGVPPDVDISNFDVSSVKETCPPQCYSWLENVTNDLKRITKEDNLGTFLFEVLQGCSQEDINRWVNTHPTYTKF